jgi:hypothetical protein
MTDRTIVSIIGAAIAATALHARPLAAQYQEPAAIHRPAVSAPNARVMSPALLPSAPIKGASVAHGVLVGAGVGAAVGLIVVVATPHSSHDEDVMGYIAGATIGAFVGMIVGGAIGATK